MPATIGSRSEEFGMRSEENCFAAYGINLYCTVADFACGGSPPTRGSRADKKGDDTNGLCEMNKTAS